MIIYQKTTKPQKLHRMFVCPAREGSDSVEFRDKLGDPIQLQVVFYDGRAEVPSNVGRWMVDKGYASSLILPAQRLVNAFRRAAHVQG